LHDESLAARLPCPTAPELVAIAVPKLREGHTAEAFLDVLDALEEPLAEAMPASSQENELENKLQPFHPRP
jgi:uncharacterized membrane protein